MWRERLSVQKEQVWALAEGRRECDIYTLLSPSHIKKLLPRKEVFLDKCVFSRVHPLKYRHILVELFLKEMVLKCKM